MRNRESNGMNKRWERGEKGEKKSMIVYTVIDGKLRKDVLDASIGKGDV